VPIGFDSNPWRPVLLAQGDRHRATRFKTTPAGSLSGVWDRTRDSSESLSFVAESGVCRQKFLGVWMLRILEQLLGACFLDDFARIHDGDAIRDLRNDAEVMGDEHDCGSVLKDDRAEDSEHLGLNGYIEARGRFISYEQGGVEDHGRCGGNALASAAAEFMRKGVESSLGCSYPHLP
jgi:hypothetical protein